jgi:iron complex outermembrane receptor protein
MSWVARLEYNYTDELYMAQDLDEALHRDALHMLNARLSLSGKDDKWQVTLWGRNLLDEEYHAIGFDVPVMGGFAGVNAPPLTYGLTLNYRVN